MNDAILTSAGYVTVLLRENKKYINNSEKCLYVKADMLLLTYEIGRWFDLRRQRSCSRNKKLVN